MQPVLVVHVREGADYWAAWGSKGWSAVRVLSVKHKWATVSRIDPRTNEVKRKRSKVRADELVLRDPTKRGEDKPHEGPGMVFKDVRLFRDSESSGELVLSGDGSGGEAVVNPNNKFASFTPEEITAWHRDIWDSMFGEGAWEEAVDVFN